MTLYYEEVQIKYFLYFAFKVQMSNEKMTGRPGHNSIRKKKEIFGEGKCLASRREGKGGIYLENGNIFLCGGEEKKER